jgi:HEAT repeat protein
MTRGILSTVTLLLLAMPALTHGGSYRGPLGEVPPGLVPGPPPQPDSTGGSYHTWLSWWGWNKFKYLDYRKRQILRREPGTATDGRRGATPKHPDAWRGEIREKHTPLMLKALHDEDEEVRTSAAVALGKWRVKKAIEPLKELRVEDKTLQVRESALLGLILMRDPALLPYLGVIAMDPEEKDRMRGYALLGIGLIDDEISREWLMQLLDPRNERARRTLPPSDRRRTELLCAAIAGMSWRRDAKLGDRLLALARDRRVLPQVRGYAIAVTGKIGATDPVPLLLQILGKEKDEHLRRSAAVALGSLGTREKRVLGALGWCLSHDRDRIVRHFATISLGRLGGPDAFAILAKHHPRANAEAESFFLIAFGLCGVPEAAPRLEKVLRAGGAAQTRAAAALALGLTEDAENAGTVREAFDDAKDWLLLEATMLSLGILDHKASADPIRQVLETARQPSVRSSAAVSFSLLRPRAANDVLAGILRTASSILTLGNVAQIMGFLPNPDAAETLVKLYEDEKLQRQARAFALVAIGSLGDAERVPLLVRIAFDMNYMIRADAVDEAVTIL